MARRYYLTNPAQLLLAGNPGKSTKAATKPATPAKPKKGRAMARRNKSPSKKAKKAQRKAASPAQIANRKRFAEESRARAAKHAPAKPAAKPARRAKTRRLRSLTKRVAARSRTAVVVHRVAPGKVRAFRAKGTRARRAGQVLVNPGLAGGLTNYVANLKATAKGGMKSVALAAAGAGGAIFAGTLLARVTAPMVAKVAPGIVANPIGARVLGAANYYLAGWALARFIPGLDAQTRRAILVGGTTAAVLEVVKPGLVRGTMARLPVVGPVFGDKLQGVADDLSGYVETALEGASNRYEPENMDAPGVSGYEVLSGLGEDENAMTVDATGDDLGVYEDVSIDR